MNYYQDKIRFRGIMSGGYGQLAKIVMLDSDLTIEAKGIYAYFVSFTGAGNNSAFPSFERIINDLGVSKDTYYKHFRLLTEHGYITVEQQQDGKFCRNLYIIEIYPRKYESMCGGSGYREKALESIREAGDISAAGYGNVPKGVMTDAGISLQAKALYAYLCVWVGQDFNAAPGREALLYHMGISHPTYNKHIKQLVDRNYVTRSNILVGGRFSGVMFHLNTSIANPDNSPESKISEAEISETESPQSKFSEAEISEAEKPEAEISETNNTSIKTIPNNNKTNVYQSISGTGKDALESEMIDGLTDNEQIFYEMAQSGCLPRSWLFDKVKLEATVSVISGSSDSLVLSGDLVEDAARKQLHELFKTCLCEMLDGNGEPTRVNGAVIPYSAVYKNLNLVLQAGFTEADEPYATLAGFPEHVISEFLKSSSNTKIRNHKAYLKAIIWTGLTTAFIAEAAAINHDFGRI